MTIMLQSVIEGWYADTDAEEMLNAVNGCPILRLLDGSPYILTISPRKLRLLAAGLARLVCTKPSIARCIEVAEHYADTDVSVDRLRSARQNCHIESRGNKPSLLAWAACWEDVGNGVRAALTYSRKLLGHERAAEVVRELFANPFIEWEFNASLLNPSTLTLGQHIYDQRQWEDLPLLADAVEECGIGCTALLAHLRNESFGVYEQQLFPAQHCRGCWALDTILGKC